MLQNFIFSANAVVPIFLIFALGYLLRRLNFLPESFFAFSDKFVFKIALPCLLFSDLAFEKTATSPKEHCGVLVFSLIGVISAFLIPTFFVPMFLKDKRKRGAIIQGIFRSNFAILGLPFAENFFGTEGKILASLLMSFVIPVYNVFAVITLSVNDPERTDSISLYKNIKCVLIGVIKNPLIISIMLALPFYLTDLALPAIFEKSVGYLAGTTLPLAFLAIGAGFKFETLKGRIGLAAMVTAIKTVVMPIIGVTIGVLLGYRGASLGLIFILFGTPTAVSSYIMAKNMNSDYLLSGQIIMLTTLSSLFTVFIGGFILKNLSLI